MLSFYWSLPYLMRLNPNENSYLGGSIYHPQLFQQKLLEINIIGPRQPHCLSTLRCALLRRLSDQRLSRRFPFFLRKKALHKDALEMKRLTRI
ncbi:hypothetical protein HPP92_015953 [Vanilla planifolia]|uniref:Uncharacterized protein n=1 Tax=Vanilla planifolia TaxID=51239 RepID=A0A835QIU6_VANPL|nr:hypothetical protein HPP92_015953 [Vanilla planifolia]